MKETAWQILWVALLSAVFFVAFTDGRALKRACQQAGFTGANGFYLTGDIRCYNEVRIHR